MRKIITGFLSVIIAAALAFIIPASVFALEADASLIIANPGADMTEEVRISWHSELEGTYVRYTKATDPDYHNAREVIGECTATPFTKQPLAKHCVATLTGLESGTEYLYKVGKNNLSAEYRFQTAGSEPFSFIHLTDIHTYTKIPARVQLAETLIAKAKTMVSDLEFALFSGDVTAYGAYYDQWEGLYGIAGAKEMMFAITPGNHDYYDVIDEKATTINSSFFNAMTNNPDNGAEDVKGTSYYFTYGNALFISIDSEDAYLNSTHLKNLKTWFQDVVSNNPKDFIIVYCHKPFYTGNGGSSTQTNFIKSNFQPLFDDAGVDLVLTGDNHILARTYPMYKDVVVSYDGTVYVVGPQLGDRAVEAGTVPSYIEFTAGGKIDGGTIVSVGDKAINLKTFQTDGTILDTYTIPSKSLTINKELYSNSVKLESDPNDISKATLRYMYQGAGRINKIRILQDATTVLQEFASPSSNKIDIDSLPTNVGFLNLTVETTFRTGEVVKKDFVLENPDLSWGTIENLGFTENDFGEVSLTWSGHVNSERADRIEVTVNGTLFATLPVSAKTVQFSQMNPYHQNTVRFRVLDSGNIVKYEQTLTYGEEADPVTIAFSEDSLELKIGDTANSLITVTPETDIALEYHSSDPSVASVDKNGKITAVDAGTCTITVNGVRRWDVQSSMTVTVRPAAKGCFNSGAILNLGLLGFVFLLRRRRFMTF